MDRGGSDRSEYEYGFDPYSDEFMGEMAEWPNANVIRTLARRSET